MPDLSPEREAAVHVQEEGHHGGHSGVRHQYLVRTYSPCVPVSGPASSSSSAQAVSRPP